MYSCRGVHCGWQNGRDVSDIEEERRSTRMIPMAPSVALLEEMWSRVLISALTVQVRVENNASNTVLVAAELLLHA